MSAHPHVGGYGEVLLHDVEGWSNWPPGASDRPFYTTYLKERHASTQIVSRHASLFNYLDYLYEPRRDLRAIGFKLMYDQLRRYPELLIYFLRRGTRVIHLMRRNVLDIYLSRETLLRRTFAHARSPEERESIQLTVDVNRLVRALARLGHQQDAARLLLQLSRLPTHNIVYEDALADDRQLHKVLTFIGITDSAEHDLTPIMLKLAPTSHRATIRNFSEVAEHLAQTRFASLLRE